MMAGVTRAEDFSREWTRKWLVKLDSIHGTADDAYEVVGVNQYDQHPSDPFARAVRPSAEPLSDDELGFWYITWVYSSKALDSGGSEGSSSPGGESSPGGGGDGSPGNTNNPDPLARSKTVVCSTNKTSEVVEFDAENTPILNSSKQLIEGVERNFATRIITVGNLYFPFSADIGQKSFLYCDTCNLFEFQPIAGQTTYSPKTVRLNDIRQELVFEANNYYWKCEFEFEWNPRQWYKEVIDRGNAEYVPGSVGLGTPDTWKPITDTEGNPMVVNLNGSGQQLAAGADPVKLRFIMHNPANWATLFSI